MLSNHKLLYLLLLSLTPIVLGQSGGNYEIKKSVIASGGGLSIGGNFSLHGTVGETSASNKATGNNYTLSGGFWHSNNNDLIFKDGFE